METVPWSQKGEGGADLPVITGARQARIRKVQEMDLEGYKSSEIASYLGISQKTVSRDIRDGKIINRFMVQGFDQDNFLGESIRFWRKIRSKSMRDSELCREENAKIGHRRNAMSAQEKMEKALQEAGLLTKVPEELKITGIPMEIPAVRQALYGVIKLINDTSEKNDGE